jgi:UDP-N-acetylglucosamine 4-epimerase
MGSEWVTDPRHADLRAALSARNRTWLVTGAAGFIGSNLVEALLMLGQRVRGLDNFATGRRSNFDDVRARVGAERWGGFTFIEGDICDLDACKRAVEGVDVVLHQAALGSVPRSVNDPLTSFQTNVSGFLNILEAVRLGGEPRLVYASSSSVYGDEPNLPKREERIGRPLSPYAATKYVDEVVAEVFCRTYGLGSVGLRYFNVFGRRQDPNGPYAAVAPKWIAAMLSGGKVEIYGDGETSRDFCFIDNTVQANLRAALINFDASHRVYNVAIGGRATLNHLFHAIRDGLNAKGYRFKQEPSYKPFRPGDVRHSQADVSKIVEGIGFVPQISLPRGIAQTLDWYVEQAGVPAQ